MTTVQGLLDQQARGETPTASKVCYPEMLVCAPASAMSERGVEDTVLLGIRLLDGEEMIMALTQTDAGVIIEELIHALHAINTGALK